MCITFSFSFSICHVVIPYEDLTDYITSIISNINFPNIYTFSDKVSSTSSLCLDYKSHPFMHTPLQFIDMYPDIVKWSGPSLVISIPGLLLGTLPTINNVLTVFMNNSGPSSPEPAYWSVPTREELDQDRLNFMEEISDPTIGEDELVGYFIRQDTYINNMFHQIDDLLNRLNTLLARYPGLEIQLNEGESFFNEIAGMTNLEREEIIELVNSIYALFADLRGELSFYGFIIHRLGNNENDILGLNEFLSQIRMLGQGLGNFFVQDNYSDLVDISIERLIEHFNF